MGVMEYSVTYKDAIKHEDFFKSLGEHIISLKDDDSNYPWDKVCSLFLASNFSISFITAFDLNSNSCGYTWSYKLLDEDGNLDQGRVIFLINVLPQHILQKLYSGIATNTRSLDDEISLIENKLVKKVKFKRGLIESMAAIETHSRELEHGCCSGEQASG